MDKQIEVSGITFPSLSLPDSKVDDLHRYISAFAAGSPANTVRALRSDLLSFEAFCRLRGKPVIPADVETVLAYAKQRYAEGVRAGTISRAISHLAQTHDALEIAHPCRNRLIALELKKYRREEPPGRQPAAINLRHIETWEAGAKDKGTLRYLRDRAVLLVAYYSMLRREEMVRIDVSWIEAAESDGTLFIPYHKGDQEKEGSYTYLSKSAVDALRDWLEAANISEGYVFRSFDLRGNLRNVRMHPGGINFIIKQRAEEMGVPGASSHSPRIGAAQDLLESGASTAQLQLAGRWSSDRMPGLYARKLDARRGAMAKLAKAQGR